jgi:transaldolase
MLVNLDTAIRLADAAARAELEELQIQTWGTETNLLVENGLAIADLWDRVTVKIPATRNGLAAASALKREGRKVTLTACYTSHQTALAAAMKLDYVAPYYGRMVEAGLDADAILGSMKEICDRQPDMRVLVASIRTLSQLEVLLSCGFETFTLSPELCALIGTSEASDKAAADFENAAAKTVD